MDIGGHIRYRESPVIGYISLPTESPFPDFPDSPATFTAPSLADPVETADRWDFDAFIGYRGRMFNDKVRYSVRLNVRNIFDEDGPVPMRPRSDGSTAIYTFKPARTFILSFNLTY